MKYYLDTSAIYLLRTIPERIQAESFYSSFSVIELIAGITVENFQKRKVILGLLSNSAVMRDTTFAEQLIFEAFDSFNKYEYKEQRITDLYGLMEDVLNTPDLNRFKARQAENQRKFDFNYFVWLDNFLTDNFYNSAVVGNIEIKEALEDSKGKAFVKIGDKKYDLDSRRAIVNFLNEPGVNDSFTIIALANAGLNILSTSFGKMTEEDVYKSYNGKLNNFLSAMSAYSTDQLINDKLPHRNDFQDLIHLLYLRSSSSLKIISNDNIYAKCIPEQSVSVSALFA